MTAPREVKPIEIGDAFPSLTGRLMSGRKLSIPHDLHGDVGIVIMTWDDTATDEMAMWRQDLLEVYGLLPDVRVIEVAMISAVGPVLGSVIDRIMVQQTPLPEREHAMVVYGDLRRQRAQLDTVMSALPQSAVFLIGRNGRLAWRADGLPTPERIAALQKALGEVGVF